MTTTDSEYQTWRLSLHEKQVEIDNLELAYWTQAITNSDGLPTADDEKKFDADRAKLVEELEQIFASDPRSRR